jgi:hypothetical protein
MDVITWSWYANHIELQIPCAEGWVCNENYGGTIAHDVPFATMEYVTKLGTIEELTQEQTDFFLSDGTLADEYDWPEGKAVLIKEDAYDSYIWFTYLERDGLEEGRHIKCEGYFEDMPTYLELIGDVEEMCTNTTVL